MADGMFDGPFGNWTFGNFTFGNWTEGFDPFGNFSLGNVTLGNLTIGSWTIPFPCPDGAIPSIPGLGPGGLFGGGSKQGTSSVGSAPPSPSGSRGLVPSLLGVGLTLLVGAAALAF